MGFIPRIRPDEQELHQNLYGYQTRLVRILGVVLHLVVGYSSNVRTIPEIVPVTKFPHYACLVKHARSCFCRLELI